MAIDDLAFDFEYAGRTWSVADFGKTSFIESNGVLKIESRTLDGEGRTTLKVGSDARDIE